MILAAPGLNPAGFGLPVPESTGYIVAAIILAVMMALAALCMVPLFPAIAIETSGVPWGRAIRDSIEHFWRLLFTLIATCLFGGLLFLLLGFGIVLVAIPLAAIFMPASPEAAGHVLPELHFHLPPFLATALAAVVFGPVFAAMASRFYYEFTRTNG
jgi:hypothetical protein